MGAESERSAAVYFFATCLVDALYPEVGLGAVGLLRRGGAEVIFPPAQTCCGQPAYNAGFMQAARAVARKQLEWCVKPYPIVVPSGSCAGMMKHHYPRLFAGTPHETAARQFAGRVYELSEYLARILKVRLEDRGAPLTITWHSSCHALREMKVVPYAKALIGQLNNVTLVPLTRETECCGFGGTFAVRQPSISAAMVQDKVDDIVRTGAPMVVTGDCGCLMNIQGAMARSGAAVASRHLAQFLWERTHVP